MSQLERPGSVESGLSPNEAASRLIQALLKNPMWEKAIQDPQFLSWLENATRRARSDMETTPTQRVHERQVAEADAEEGGE